MMVYIIFIKKVTTNQEDDTNLLSTHYKCKILQILQSDSYLALV